MPMDEIEYFFLLRNVSLYLVHVVMTDLILIFYIDIGFSYILHLYQWINAAKWVRNISELLESNVINNYIIVGLSVI